MLKFLKSSSFVLALMLLTPTLASAAFNRDLTWGMNGADVTELQIFLAAQGFYTGEPTGGFYLLTEQAVRKFQEKYGIDPALGFFGEQTRQKAQELAQGTAAPVAAAVPTEPVPTKVDTTLVAMLLDRLHDLEDQLLAILASASEDTVASSISSRSSRYSTPIRTTPTYTPRYTPKPVATSTKATSTTPTKATSTAATSTATTTTTTTTKPPVSSGLAWGVYTGDKLTDLTAFEKTIGKTASIQAVFWGWDDTFPTVYDSLPAGKTLIVYWEPSFGYDSINSGNQDTYIASFAKGAKAYAAKHPLILIPFDEMNLGEEAWGDIGNNTPQKFVSAWKRIHDIFVANGATNVKFGLAYNNESTGTHKSFDDYYPGSDYVDYVGVDGFNFGSQSFATVFDTAMKKVATYGKPTYIFSMGTVSNKSAWITDALTTGLARYKDLVGWVWFNEGQWRVDSDTQAAQAFAQALPK